MLLDLIDFDSPLMVEIKELLAEFAQYLIETIYESITKYNEITKNYNRIKDKHGDDEKLKNFREDHKKIFTNHISYYTNVSIESNRIYDHSTMYKYVIDKFTNCINSFELYENLEEDYNSLKHCYD